MKTKDTIEDIFPNRPELQQAILQYQAALLREGMSANDSLPELDLVLELTADGGADGRCLSDSFVTGPTVPVIWSVSSFLCHWALTNAMRATNAVAWRPFSRNVRCLSVIQTILLEVDVSANEYVVACNDLIAQRKSLAAAQSSLRTLERRWSDGGASEGGIGLLSALFARYEQVQQSEQAVATARATREIAAANLARARGVLLDRWGLKTNIAADTRGEPTYQLTRQ